MKWFYPSVICFCLAFFLLVPLAAVPEAAGAWESTPGALQAGTPAAKPATEIRLKRTDSDEILTLAAREYVFGAVAAEMPMTYSDEALKAQAVVCYTYALYQADKNKETDYDLTDDSSTHQAFLTRAEAMEKWGGRAEEYAKRLDSITSEIEGLYLTYNNEPILAVCHDTSCGKTQNASDVWGGEYPYLVSVESVGDLLSPSYQSQKTVSAEEFAETMGNLSAELSEDASKWVTDTPVCYDSGTVKSLTVGGKKFKGTEIRQAFGLKSAAFTVTYAEDSGFTFTVRGYGHGVGMSQTGANYMALCGSDYKEILNWYYTDVKLTDVSRETQ